MLFSEELTCWADWGRVYQSIPAFTPLIRAIESGLGLAPAPITPLTPGTNAVFRLGARVIKIYAPAESGMDQTADRQTELNALRLAESRGIPAPKVLAEGILRDRYDFAWMLMEHIDGCELGHALESAPAPKQRALGAELRRLTRALNRPAPPLNGIDILRDPVRTRRWEIFPAAFRESRASYLAAADLGSFVAVHGDLCADNILVTDRLVPIDFADAVMAPEAVEHALIFFEYSPWPAFLHGYFAEEERDALPETLLRGILLHGYGAPILAQRLGDPAGFASVDALRDALTVRCRTQL